MRVVHGLSGCRGPHVAERQRFGAILILSETTEKTTENGPNSLFMLFITGLFVLLFEEAKAGAQANQGRANAPLINVRMVATASGCTWSNCGKVTCCHGSIVERSDCVTASPERGLFVLQVI